MDHSQRSTTRVPLWLASLAAGALLLVLHAALEVSSLRETAGVGRAAFGQEPG